MNLALSNRYPASGDVTVTGTVSDGRIDWDSHYTGVGAKPQEKDRATGTGVGFSYAGLTSQIKNQTKCGDV